MADKSRDRQYEGGVQSSYDSLQSALASLDAASEWIESASQSRTGSLRAVVHQHHLTGKRADDASAAAAEHGQTKLSERPFSVTWRAKPRQATTNDDERRALIGGPTSQEMMARVKQRSAKRREENAKEARATEISADGMCDNATNLVTQESNKNTADTLLPNESGKKRALSWSARRDRRNARRRSSPPLTRRRAAERSEQEVAGRWTKDGVSLAISGGETVEQRDSEIVEEEKSSSNGRISTPSTNAAVLSDDRATFKSHVRAPRLNLTLTEPSVTLHHPESFSIATQASSLTQSETEDESSEVIHSHSPLHGRRQRDVPSASDTEDEDEAHGDVRRTTSLLPPFKVVDGDGGAKDVNGRSQLRSSATARTKERTVTEIGKTKAKALRQRDVRTPKAVTTEKRERVHRHARPLFKGFVFALAGFWSRVQMYEKLIEKHAGTVISTSEPAESAALTHFIFCPHGTFTPSRDVCRSSLEQWCQGRPETVEGLRRGGFHLIDARWISDCIESCLRQTDLLRLDDYRLTF